MSKKEKTFNMPESGNVVELTDEKFLILHNDDINTFDFVIESLIEVCKLDHIQAEQCATIAHHKGKCDVKKADFYTLKPLKEELDKRGLSITIE